MCIKYEKQTNFVFLPGFQPQDNSLCRCKYSKTWKKESKNLKHFWSQVFQSRDTQSVIYNKYNLTEPAKEVIFSN